MDPTLFIYHWDNSWNLIWANSFLGKFPQTLAVRHKTSSILVNKVPRMISLIRCKNGLVCLLEIGLLLTLIRIGSLFLSDRYIHPLPKRKACEDLLLIWMGSIQPLGQWKVPRKSIDRQVSTVTTFVTHLRKDLPLLFLGFVSLPDNWLLEITVLWNGTGI